MNNTNDMPEEIWISSRQNPSDITTRTWGPEPGSYISPIKYTRTQPSTDEALLAALKQAKAAMEVTGLTTAHKIVSEAIQQHEARK